MDCYLGCVVDDLVVPSNRDIINMFPTPNCWSQWELLSAEAFNNPMSKYFATETNLPGTGLNYNRRCQNKKGMDLFEYQQDEHSINSDFCQEFKEDSVNQDTSSCDVSDYQLDHLDMTNQTDGIFMNSHDTGTDTYTGPLDYYGPEFENEEYGVLGDTSIDSECDPSQLYGMGSSKYLKTHDSSPYAGGGDRHYTQFLNLSDRTPSPIEAQYEEVSVSPEFEMMDDHINNETSVLQDLEIAMTQMSNHSRICFRDALYRLAENSRQQSMDFALERAPLLMSHDKSSSLENSRTEAETNAVDRAVANIMFYKMDGNVQNLSQGKSSSSGDAEVPMVT